MYYYDDFKEIKGDFYNCGILKKKYNDFIVNDLVVENNRGIINDTVYIENNKVINIKERSKQHIAGILYMNLNKSYGRNKKGMNYYKFKALHKKFGSFLVPCSFKSKRKIYISIIFNKWDKTDKYPIGICNNIIGELGVRENEYNILLYKYDLKFNKVKYEKKQLDLDLKEIIEDIDYNIITIDPENCRDIDDGISISKNENITEIGVHITDVSNYMISYIDNIKKGLCSSIYFNKSHINMIPEIYATNICSLLENTKKKCISIIYKYNNNKLVNFEVKLCNVYITKNYSYDEAEKLIMKRSKNNDILLNLWDFMSGLDNNIIDTHKLIEKLMINSNKIVAELLFKYDRNNTILRIHNKNENYDYNHKLSKKINDYLKIKTYESAVYVIGDENPYHYDLNTSYYTHYTSPIRRIIDIINHLNLKQYLKNDNLICINNDLIDKINKQNKLIKKMNYDCRILDIFYNINDKEYECSGIIIDIDEKKMKIYIDELNMEYKYRFSDNKIEYKIFDIINLKLYFIREGEKLEDKILVKLLNTT